MFSALFQGMRTIGATPAPAMTPNICESVRISIALCSVSATSQSKPSVETYSAASGLGRASQVPTEGSPAASRCRTWFARMGVVLSPWQAWVEPVSSGHGL